MAAPAVKSEVTMPVVALEGQFSCLVATALEGASLSSRGASRVVMTPPSQGAPAAVFGRLQIGPPVPASPYGYVIRVRCKRIAGDVGIGVFDAQHRLLTELHTSGTENDLTGDLFVADLTPCVGLLVRNLSAASSTYEFAEIAVFALRAPPPGHRPVPSPAPEDKAYALHDVTTRTFTPHAKRRSLNELFYALGTTEVCNLNCVYCHYNGPKATKKARTLPPEMVRKVIDEMPKGTRLGFAGTGEILMDPNAIDYFRYAVTQGITPDLLSHGQFHTPEMIDSLLEAGLRNFRFSCDTIDPVEYAKIRRGGTLEKVLEACAYLRQRKSSYPDIDVMICATLLSTTMPKRQQMIDYWVGKVDQISFHAEYYNTFRFRNILYNPKERVDCDLNIYVMASGKIAPCCAIMSYEHDGDSSWMPDVRTHTLQQAYDQLCDMYEDPSSPLANICKGCDWWIQFHHDETLGRDRTPFHEVFRLPEI